MNFGHDQLKSALDGYDSGDEEYKNIVAKSRPVAPKNPLGRGLEIDYAPISALYIMYSGSKWILNSPKNQPGPARPILPSFFSRKHCPKQYSIPRMYA